MYEGEQPLVVTSVRVRKDDYEWVKRHDTTWRAIVRAGIRRLQEGPEIDRLRQEAETLKSTIRRAEKARFITSWVFKHRPEVYEQAEKEFRQTEED